MRTPPPLRLWIVVATAGAACGPVGQRVGSLDTPPPSAPVTPPPQIPTIAPEWNCTTTTGAAGCFRDPAVTVPSPDTIFAGPGDQIAANRPILVYPLAGSTHPINLSDITFQWRRAAGGGQRLFRIRITHPTAAGDRVYDFFVPCDHVPPAQAPVAEECVYQMPPGAWLAIAGESRGDAVTIEVSGADETRAYAVATSTPATVSFSPSDVAGGFYYWSTSLLGTYRLLFGAQKATPFIKPGSPANPSGCAGCHVVSRNGAVIAFTAGENADSGFLRATSTADPTRPLFGVSGMHDSSTIAVSPDGARLLVSYSDVLVLRDTATGAVLGQVDPAFLAPDRKAYHPEWSPDGQQIAVTLSAQPVKDWSVRTGSIAVLPYNGGSFGPAQVVAPQDASDFNFYPTWSPDGQWIAFASAPRGNGTDSSYDRADARLRLVASTGGAIHELGNATFQPGHTSTWPKFAPHMQANGSVMFITFNSKIDYGFFLKRDTTGGAPQLWLSAIDLRKLAAGGDPSSAPVWLPFQEVTQRNHLGFWTTQVGCRLEADGSSSGCGEREACREGRCVMVVQ
jgi:hypothetical protein